MLGLFSNTTYNPSLSFNFLSNSSLISQQGIALNFSRGTGATQIDSSGNMTFAPENLWTYSEDPNNAAWAKAATTYSVNPISPPTNISNCGKVMEDAANTLHSYGQTYTYQAGLSYTQSWYLKAAENQYVQLNMTGSAFGNFSYANFDLINGTATVVGATATAAITLMGDGWYRCSVTASATATATGTSAIVLINGGTAPRVQVYAGTAGNGLYFAAPQVERSITPRAYNPTTSAAYYGARFDYNPTGVTYTGQNLALYSQTFTNVAWTKTAGGTGTAPTLTANYGLAPDETMTATRMQFDKGAGATQSDYSLVSQSAIVSPAEKQLFSVYLKTTDGSTKTLLIRCGNLPRTSITVTADWQRFSVFCNIGDSSAGFISFGVRGSFVTPTTSDTADILAWGAQLEVVNSSDATPSTYIVTTSTAITGTATATPRGLRIEEQRTNLCTYSRDPSNAAWGKTDTTVTSNTTETLSPEGVNNATKLTEGVAGTAILVSSGSTITAGSIVTGSMLVKRGNTDWLRLSVYNGAGTNGINGWFNLATGAKGSINAAGTGTAQSSDIISLKNGWFICSVTGLMDAADTVVVHRHSSASADASNTRVNNATRYVLDAQIEVSLLASTARRTSFIPTGAAAVTRSADISTTAIGSWYNQNEGIFDVDWEQSNLNLDASARGVLVNLDSGSSANRHVVFANAAGGLSQGTTSVASVAQAGIASGVLAANTVYKTAYGYKLNDFAFAQNNAIIGADTSGTIPTNITQIQLGQRSNDYLNGWIRNFAYYNTKLANSLIQGLTR